MDFLKVAGVGSKVRENFVVRNIHFTQRRSQRIAIAGETGSGKSTLLKMIAGWIPPDEGEVWFENERVKKAPAEKLIPGHPGIAYLSQQFELPNFLRVRQVLQYANTLDDVQAVALYEVCRIAHLLDRRTDELSGGEKQRIAIARLLTGSPRLLLLDEPYSNLDMGHKNILKAVIRDIGERLNISCILVSHDPIDTLSWAEEILVLRDGRLVQQGTPAQVYRQPVDLYTAALVGKYTVISAATASSLFGLPEAPVKEMLLLRPEELVLAPGGHGIVTRVYFFGSYYEVEVSLQENIFLVRATSNEFSVGDRVSVVVLPGSGWWL